MRIVKYLLRGLLDILGLLYLFTPGNKGYCHEGIVRPIISVLFFGAIIASGFILSMFLHVVWVLVSIFIFLIVVVVVFVIVDKVLPKTKNIFIWKEMLRLLNEKKSVRIKFVFKGQEYIIERAEKYKFSSGNCVEDYENLNDLLANVTLDEKDLEYVWEFIESAEIEKYKVY